MVVVVVVVVVVGVGGGGGGGAWRSIPYNGLSWQKGGGGGEKILLRFRRPQGLYAVYPAGGRQDGMETP